VINFKFRRCGCCPWCIEGHAKVAMKEGASKEEIAEVIQMNSEYHHVVSVYENRGGQNAIPHEPSPQQF